MKNGYTRISFAFLSNQQLVFVLLKKVECFVIVAGNVDGASIDFDQCTIGID